MLPFGSQVQLRKHGNAKKFPAKVLATGHEVCCCMDTISYPVLWFREMLVLGSLWI